MTEQYCRSGLQLREGPQAKAPRASLGTPPTAAGGVPLTHATATTATSAMTTVRARSAMPASDKGYYLKNKSQCNSTDISDLASEDRPHPTHARSNVLVAGVTPHDARPGDLNSWRLTRHRPQFSDTSPTFRLLFSANGLVSTSPISRSARTVPRFVGSSTRTAAASGDSPPAEPVIPGVLDEPPKVGDFSPGAACSALSCSSQWRALVWRQMRRTRTWYRPTRRLAIRFFSHLEMSPGTLA